MGRTLVLSGGTRHGLVAIRQLTRAGVTVTAAGPSRLSPARFSRYTDDFLRYPDPAADREGFQRTVERELERRDYDLLLPVDGGSIEPIVAARDRLEPHTELPFPPTEQFELGYDKARTMEMADEVDVPHPQTECPEEVGIDGVDARLEYPVIVKPRHGRARMGVHVCADRTELTRAVTRARSEHGPVMVQSYVPNGGERGVYTLYNWDSDLRGVTVQQRLRSTHPDGGPSTLRETVADPDLIEATDRLLSAMEWQGVAMAEYRVDPRTDTPQLIEVNPRLWGSLRLTVAAGMNAPVLLYQLATTGECDAALEYDHGVRAHWLLGDAMQALSGTDRLTAVREVLQSVSETRQRDVLSVDDPLPGFSYGLSGLWRNLA
ncbi:carboxylate--amine ligase [Halorientalis salina]|uniref:carboxylate--amine ligase n=1 Tax=Halorientalis salina TaxID=2932266 RepID=UPI0010ACCFB0|nr:ATP-grasp domain-containing protein [Halorientalis salina]